jgi:hypothetical protein
MALAERRPQIAGGERGAPPLSNASAYNLLGRYMLADRREFPVRSSHVARRHGTDCAGRRPSRRAHIATSIISADSKGHVARVFQNGFRETIGATTRKREQARRAADLARQPPHPRFARKTAATPHRFRVDPIGRLIPAERPQQSPVVSIDVSQSGAGLATRISAPHDRSLVTLGKINRERVVRHLEDGFCHSEFTSVQQTPRLPGRE